jgi:hypothetical protein
MAALSTGGETSPPPPLSSPPRDIEAFCALTGLALKSIKVPPSKFVKKIDEIPKVPVHASSSKNVAVCFATNGLIGQFTGIWPSLTAVANWVDQSWKPLIKGKVSSSFYGKGFFCVYV